MQRDVIKRSIIRSAQPGDGYGIERDLRGEYRKRNRIKKSVLSKERVLINFFSPCNFVQAQAVPPSTEHGQSFLM